MGLMRAVLRSVAEILLIHASAQVKMGLVAKSTVAAQGTC